MCFFYNKKLVRPSFMIRGTIMTTNQLMFMYAVEEMSFSKAAQKAFVTQQCLSNHIHRLEVSCGVKLFERTPHLQLTEAGKTLYQSFIQIRDIEEGTLQKLKDRYFLDPRHNTLRNPLKPGTDFSDRSVSGVS